MEQMIKVQIEGKEYEYPAGTTYQTIAGDFQKEYEDDILLVLFDHRGYPPPFAIITSYFSDMPFCPGPVLP